MQQASKSADLKFLLKPVQSGVGDVKNFKNRDPNLNNHVQTVADGFNLFNWFLLVSIAFNVMLQADVKEIMEENLKQIDFYGFKVLQLKKDPDTAWQRAYKSLAQSFTEFIIDAAENNTLTWKGT